MAIGNRIRTIDFLPEIFQTPTNKQFLGATLDQIVNPPNTKKIEGFIGSNFGYGINSKNYYVTEPTKIRTDYQLDPGVVFTKPNESVAKDFISYPGIIDALKLNNGITNDNNRLFNSQFYSWDSFTDLDKLINYNQYYWLPEGPPSVTVSNEVVFSTNDYIVTNQTNGYNIRVAGTGAGAINPTLTLLRGGSYNFIVDQDSQFWIQGVPGVTGFDPSEPNLQTRDVLGVSNNGAESGVVTFNVPFKNAQDEFNLPGNNLVDLVSSTPYANISGLTLNQIIATGGIDGVTNIEGLTVLFYNTGVANEQDNLGANVNDYFYTVTFLENPGQPDNPFVILIPASLIPINQKITANFGDTNAGLDFFKNITGVIQKIPYLSASLDVLYYQDGTSANKVGVIRLIENNVDNTLNVVTDILGKTNYTSRNGVVFTNGLKVSFDGDVNPRSYLEGEYYVQGVGTSIQLINVLDLVCPESFTSGIFIPYDTLSYDIGNYDSNLFIPITPDYITIARDSINKNAWSRSNRWFHIDVIKATATYNNNPNILTDFAPASAKAKRPIIEFYPNIKLFNSGTIGKNLVDFIDYRATDAFNQVVGQQAYYPDVEVYTAYAATILPNPTVAVGSFIPQQTYKIVSLGTTTQLDWNILANTINTVASKIVADKTYKIKSLGNTDWNDIGYIGIPVVGGTFTATKKGAGSGLVDVEYSSNDVFVAYQTGTDTMGTGITLAQSYTTLTIDADAVTGTFAVGQYVSDLIFDGESVLPNGSRILEISGVTTYTLTIDFSTTKIFEIEVTDVALVANDTANSNFILSPNARIVFANDENLSIRNKIYVVNFESLTLGSTPVITLTEAQDGQVLDNDQITVARGYNYQGDSFYYNANNWILAQLKITVNQPPLFDVFDKNGISFSDQSVYVGSSFKGSTLFSYGLGVGPDDIVLGFPLRFSSVDNLGDISFDVTLNSQTFDYVSETNPITQFISTGYVHDCIDRVQYIRGIGWQTAVSPSVQYQLFEFKFDPSVDTTTFVCDVQAYTTTQWPNIFVYDNNKLLSTDEYTIIIGTNTTTITLQNKPLVSTEIEILVLSDQVSKTAYYQIPINLSNNPFNSDITTASVGDIRGQYQSMFNNAPNTSGPVFGANNFRDLGNLVPYGNRIIQNSASLVLPGAFLRQQNNNLFNSLLFNSREYIKFKAVLIDTVNKTEYLQQYNPAFVLDNALDQITASKSQEQSFFWSDMLPSKSAFVSNTYTFRNNADISIYPLLKVYNFDTANYESVLIYRTTLINGTIVTQQLIKNVDYIISDTEPSVTVTKDLSAGDRITVKQYTQTFGSYVPNTPTKLGLYPSYIPKVVLDVNYLQPTYFILGHDGSYTRLYGDYDPVTGLLVDFRDQALLEFEQRVYNNLKLPKDLPLPATDIIPGFFRTTDYSYDEILEIYSVNFLNWIGENRLEYKNQLYSPYDQFTYNYKNSGNKLTSLPIQQGNFRGIYTYFYDTSTPNTTPWEMLGFTSMPDWWVDRYGPAPYTKDNLILWTDLSQGLVYGEGIVKPQYIRPQLLEVIPVDSAGNLLSPLDVIVGNYNSNTFRKSWSIGDDGPVELSYRRSSSYPFDLMKILALTEPAKFFNLGVDLDNYRYNPEFNQYLVNDRKHLIIDEIEIYGSGIAKTSYINWIVDYQKQAGIDATKNIKDLLFNLDVRLVYRVAGFTDKNLLKFYVEKGTPNSNNASLLIPDESYNVLLYDNIPFDKITFSSIIVQIVGDKYAVFGNNQTNAYFNTLLPNYSKNKKDIKVEDIEVSIYENYLPTEQIIPYGTLFSNIQEVSQFISNYNGWLVSKGIKFDQIENGIPVTWQQMIAEFLYWVQLGWETGSVITLNPAAKKITIEQPGYVVQPLVLQQQNFILNQNLYPIQITDLAVVRDNNLFDVEALNEGDTISFGQFYISNIEHGIVFDNTTLFNDVIYNLVTGLRQIRIYSRGTKTAEWNGTLNAYGFILNQDNILEWQKDSKYTKGAIVKYKNKFWTALKIVQPQNKFNELEWKETDYNEIQKGLLPNSSTRSYESTLYYNVNKANLEQDADLLSFSLIGYRPRDYLALADLTDITQVNVYKNFIKEKGTRNSVSAFKGAKLPQGGIDYEVYENWAIKSATYGGVENNNFVEFRLNESLLTGNPSIVGLTNGVHNDGVQQEVPIYSLYNYQQPITNPNILPTIHYLEQQKLLPDAGYVNYNDVKMSSYFYSGLPTAVDKNGNVVTIDNFYVGEYVWLANYLENWQVMTPYSIGQVVNVRSNTNNTCTVTFAQPHNLSQYQIFSIINFDTNVNGYYLVSTLIDPYKVIINLILPASVKEITGQGIALVFQSNRVSKPSDIINLPLLNSEFTQNRVWVDTNTDGSWAVYDKKLNYTYGEEFNKAGSVKFGSAVATGNKLGYLISDSGLGNAYRYVFDGQSYKLTQTLQGDDSSFGYSIVYANDIFVISQPTTTPKIYVYILNDTLLSNELVPYQTAISAPIGFTEYGTMMAISADSNWLYITGNDGTNNKIHVYNRQNSLNAYQYVTEINDEITSGDNFGYSLATDYTGSTLIVGIPSINNGQIENNGSAVVYSRNTQNFEVQTNSAAGTTQLFNLAWTPNSPYFVTVDGILVDGAMYTVTGNQLSFNGELKAGQIIQFTDSTFVKMQTLDAGTEPKVGKQFGYALDCTTQADELLIGAPFELTGQRLQEGAAYRFTNVGCKFGKITSNNVVNITAPRQILINGYNVTIPIGNASVAANAINSSNITNVEATSIDNLLTISVVDTQLSVPHKRLNITAPNNIVFDELGFEIYKNTQTVLCPHEFGPTQFGATIKFNEFDSVVISAITGTRYTNTTFDFSDDINFTNDTIFDNNATQFIDTFVNAGSVYMFDYLQNYQEDLNNLGKFVYAQSLNSKNLEYGSQPRYGQTLDFNENKVIIGTPNFRPDVIDGQAIIYENDTGVKDWSVSRFTAPIVDINQIQNIQLFSAETNNRLINLDYFDPLQGKLLGSVRQNIDVISNFDPADYNNGFQEQRRLTWGSEKVGSIWLDTTNIRWVNYHQNNDVVYNSKYWGAIFSGSDVAVYSWISSNVTPDLYEGPGTPYDVNLFSVKTILDANNIVTPVYYFWVRNSNIVFQKRGKTLADSIIEQYIRNPKNSGISYFSPLLPNVFGLYNSTEYINNNDSVLHIGYSLNNNNDIVHNEYTLIRTNYAEDFLPGVPGRYSQNIIDKPEYLYDRLLDSLSGVDEMGSLVPNPYLPKATQSGVLVRPRQSFFYNRLTALENYFGYANEIMSQYPIVELVPNIDFLFAQGEFYNTQNYWEYVNWWAPGYDDNTKSILQVPYYADLSKLTVPAGTIVTVETNANGNSETYLYTQNSMWTRIGLQNGTIRIKSDLWDYASARLGFGDNFFDTTPYDSYPSEETRYIIRVLNEQIFVGEFLIFRNKSLILLFEYIQAESIENQNYLPWLNKTSLIDVNHTIRELKPYETFVSDNQEFLQGYINETKPYHVVIKDFLFTYTGIDVYDGDITDFDLPATYNQNVEQFISPQYVYDNPQYAQYTPADSIWSNSNYTQWFNNFGLSIVGQNNYQISTLAVYLTTGASSLVVDNVSGFPINGTIRIGEELIGYASVDLESNTLFGLVRGVNETEVTVHFPGENIYIDLPPVIVLDGGRGYTEPPKVTAYINPENTKTATFTGTIVNNILTIDTISTGSIILGNYIDGDGILPSTQILSSNIDGTYNVTETPSILIPITITQYVGPREPAELEAVMSLDSVFAISVINPGNGYLILPEIKIDPAFTVYFDSTNVNTTLNTIQINNALLQTGDLVQYIQGSTNDNIGGLIDNQWYYVNILSSGLTNVIALYTRYIDAINDEFRVKIYSTGTGVDYQLNLGAKATSVTISSPVRENNITLRYDRTSYTSQVTNWGPEVIGFDVGCYDDTLYDQTLRFYAGTYVDVGGRFASSTEPSSSTSILASSQGVIFEVTNVANCNNNAIVTLDYSGVSPGQINGQQLTFYASPTVDSEISEKYYIKVITETSFELYSDPLLQAPVSYDDFVIGYDMTGYGGVFDQTFTSAFLPEPFYFNPSIVKFNNRVYLCIISNSDNEFDFDKWQLLDSGDRRLNAMDRVFGYYQPTINMPGIDLSQLFTGVTYPNSVYKGNNFDTEEQFTIDINLQDQPFTVNDPTTYNVMGDRFLSGYGPEELVPGVVSDNLTMIVTTRPGTNWPATEYAGVGYMVKSIEITPKSNTQYTFSFDKILEVPQQVAVFQINKTSNLSTSLYEGIDYSVNWIDNTITFLNTSNPLNYISSTDTDKVRIDIYETGNGDQLVKSSTKIDPLRTNDLTGEQEIYLNCNYSAYRFNGNGIINPDTNLPWTDPLVYHNGTKLVYGVDYTFDIQPNGLSAKIIFVMTYDTTVDYLTYTLFGETEPSQYGYTIPETQLITADGTAGPFSLVNYVGGDNPNNAIVEVNGLRVSRFIAIPYDTTLYDTTGYDAFADYTIDPSNNTITFITPPPMGARIAVTSYNLTDRQNFNTQVIFSPTSTFIIFGPTQTNVDRLWVTINGYRVPSSLLQLVPLGLYDIIPYDILGYDNTYTQLTILTTVLSTDTVMITSMVPSATPNEESYINLVNQNGFGTVYRAGPLTRTWLTEPLYDTQDTIQVCDVTNVTESIFQTNTAPTPVDGTYTIGLMGDKDIIVKVIVYNASKSQIISPNDYSITIEMLAPTLKIDAGSYIDFGDNLEITVIQGNAIIINGEQIVFREIDLVNNSVSDLQRGANGTGIQTVIPKYSEVYSLLPNNRLDSDDYNKTWNSDNLNPILGDPLQLSTTQAALFLNRGET